MAQILSYTLFAFAILALVMAFSIIRKKDYDLKRRILFFLFSISSFWWSIWYSFLIIQTEPHRGYLCRAIAMPGVFSYLILGTLLVRIWSDVKNCSKLLSRYIAIFSLLGFVILPFIILPSASTFYLADFGMSYEFTPGFWNNAYTIYSVVIGLNLLIMIILMLQKKNRLRTRALGRKILFCCIVIFLGMIIDTICPLIGIGAFPGSTLTQFLGAFIMYITLRFDYDNEITFKKISEIILHTFTTPVIVLNENGRLILINDTAKDFFHIKDIQVKAVYFPELFGKAPDFQDNTRDLHAIESRCVINQRDCEISIDKLYDHYKDILGYIAIIKDVTERNHFISELEKAKNEANQANESKSIFLANMSHEIRTPINAVLGMDEMILREDNLDNIRNYAQNIRTAGKTLLAIINEILDFSKIESGKMELVNANFALDTTLFDLTNSVFLRAKEKNLIFETDLDPSTPKILFGDELRIKQIVLNLLTNAVKYTEKGTVYLSMSYNKIDDHKIILRFVVKDTGIGIKEEDMNQLFSSFKRLDDLKNRSVEGTGLGLNIVEKLLDLMGGTIQVESVYQQGSTFTVSMPIMVMDWAPIGAIEKMDKTPSPDFVPFKSGFVAPEASILSVDDNRVNLKVFKGLLKETQVRIDAVTSGEKCLEFVQKKKYDIIFLDHMMPGMDGVETLERMRAMKNNLSKDAPVIVLTANALNGVEEKYYGYGFDGYLAKPIDYEALEAMIRKFLPPELILKI